MALLSVIRRWHFRQKLSIREIARRTGLSRNTIRKYLRDDSVEPKFKLPSRPSKLDPFADRLSAWLKTEANKPRKQKRTLKQLHADLLSLGYEGSYNRVAAFARDWRVERQKALQISGRGTFVPLAFDPGEAFQFDWSEDWAIIGSEYRAFAKGLPDRVLDHLRLLDGDFGGFPICRLEHSLQTATRAHRDGRDEPYVVMALLHDIGDTLGSYNHPEVAASIIKPFVSEEVHWICQNHGAFQGYYYFHFLGMDQNARDKFTGHPHYEACRLFCEKYDQAAFDPDYDSEPLEFFEPMVRRVMARPLASAYAKALEQE